MDDFFKHLSTTDTKKKLSVGQEIIDDPGATETSTECEDMGAFIDGLVPWMQSSNFRVRPFSQFAFTDFFPRVIRNSYCDVVTNFTFYFY